MASQNKRPKSTVPLRLATTDVGNTYRHYYKLDAGVEQPDPPPDILIKKHTVQRRLLKSAIRSLEIVHTLAEALEQKLSKAIVQGKKKLPKSAKLQLEKLYRNLIGAMGHLQDITLPEVKPILETAEKHRKTIEPFMAKGTCVELFGRDVDLSWYKSITNTVEVATQCWTKQLSIYRKVLKKEIHVLRERPKQEQQSTTGALQIPKDVQPRKYETFRESVIDKGWKIKEEPKEEPEEELRVSNGFDASIDTLNGIQSSELNLLHNSVPVGIIRFPIIIVQGTNRFTDSVIKELIGAQLNYDIHKVFGDYIIIAQAMLMGIHKKLMHVYDVKVDPHTKRSQVVLTPLGKNNIVAQTSAGSNRPTSKKAKVKVDWRKFTALMPYVKKEFPEYSGHLERVGPVNPVIKHSSHYYSLLFPNTLCRETEFSLGRWSPLTETNAKQI